MSEQEKINERITKIQVDMVREISKLSAGIETLTTFNKELKEEMTALKTELKRRDDLYEPATEHTRDIQDIYKQLTMMQENMNVAQERAHNTHNALRRNGTVKALLWSLFTVILTVMIRDYIARIWG